MSTDLAGAPPPLPPPAPAKTMTASKSLAFSLFRLGTSIDDVMTQTGRTRPTVVDYLAEYIRAERPAGVQFWVDEPTYARVAEVARRVGFGRLKPIFLALGEQVPYDDIRVAVAHLTRDLATSAQE
jgi:ATP-dependent DNA helicase RecQ